MDSSYSEENELCDRHAPIIVFNGYCLSPYAVCLPVIFPFTPISVDAKNWFIKVFCDCFEKEQRATGMAVATYAASLLEYIEARQSDADYIKEVNVAFQDIAIPESQKHFWAIVAVLGDVIKLANYSSTCSWIARGNAEKLGPDFMPWPMCYVPAF